MSAHKKSLFRGAATALLTPFSDGRVDYEAFKRLVLRQIGSGISALVVCGTTGEAPTLSADEKNSLISLTKEISDGKVPVIAGVTSNDTRKNVSMVKDAERHGADAVMVAAPYYNKPTEDGILYHFYSVADAVSIPVIAYNVPSRVGVSMTKELCNRLAEHENVVGLKEASGSLSLPSECLSDPDFPLALYSGNDDLTLPILSLGGHGVISVIANIFPREVSLLCRSFFEGDIKKAQMLHRLLFPLTKALFGKTNPIPVKALAARIGLCENELRPPMIPLSENECGLLFSLYESITRQNQICIVNEADL